MFKSIMLIRSTALALATGKIVSFAAKAVDPPPVLTRASQIRALTLTESRRRYPVLLRGAVTFYAPEFGLSFVQDATAGIFLNVNLRDNAPNAHLGDLIEVHGVTGPGDFAPVVDDPRIRVLGRTPLPLS